LKIFFSYNQVVSVLLISLLNEIENKIMKLESRKIFLLFLTVLVINNQHLLGQVYSKLNNEIIKSEKINIDIPRNHQLGLSLRSNNLNLNYKKQINKNYLFRTSLALPTLSFRSSSINSLRVLDFSIALGLERTLLDRSWFKLYAAGEIRTKFNYGGSNLFLNYFIHAIAGIGLKVSDNILAFIEIQPGLQLLERGNFSEVFVHSDRAFNFGVNVLL